MTSRFTLLFAVAGISLAGCSSPAPGGGGTGTPPPPPSGVPNFANNNGQGGTTQTGVDPLQGQGGTGQTNTGQGGTVSAPTAGTGNVGQAGTTTLPPGDGEIPIGEGLAITPGADGWVAGEDNGLGVQGAFFTASDADTAATGTTITMDTATTPGSVCVSGSLAQIAGTDPDFEYETYWGANVGMNLRQVLPAGGGEALDASGWSRVTPAGTVTGFTYTIAGTAIPGLRFTVDFVGRTAGTYCSPIPLGGASTSLASVVNECWMGGAMSPPLGGDDLLTIQWSLLPTTAAPTPFNFCISNIQATVSP